MNFERIRIEWIVGGCLGLVGPACGGDDGASGDEQDSEASESSGTDDSIETSADATFTSTDTTTDADETSDSATSTSTDDGDDDDSTSSTTGEAGQLGMELIGRYESGLFDGSAAEISAYDPVSMRLFVVSASTHTVDVLDLADPTAPTLVESITMAGGGSPNSVDVHDGVVAVAVQNADPQVPGQVQFFAVDGDAIASVTVGALPDMLTFTPDGSRVVVANEGEPDSSYTVDPEGSISIVDLGGGVDVVTDDDVVTAGFAGFELADLDPSIRIFGPGATVAQDLEPEYVAVAPDGTTAWVTLQENNALAIVDLDAGEVTELVGLGFKDHAVDGRGLDPSDEDGEVAIATWPVSGVYMPDAIAVFGAGAATFLVTANEGDARDYDGFGEEERVLDLVLDRAAFPDAAELQAEAALGRLRVTSTLGDDDDDGDYDALFSFGGRSISVWDDAGALVWDSGDLLERTVADALPEEFNSNNDENDGFDSRSDDKGPEPEGVVVAELFESTYAFVGLERVGGIVAFDLGDPRAPEVAAYVNDRDFTGDPEQGTAGDLGPEGLLVISAADSPTGTPLLVVAHEVSGSVAIYELSHR